MLSSPETSRGRRPSRPTFVVYVEGARDREILRRWAHRLSARLGRALAGRTVILGGRQPNRAADHFRDLHAADGGSRGLCILDRDDTVDEAGDYRAPPGLEFFVWRRRHIESYLLVPAAICRFLGPSENDGRVDRALREHLPEPADEETLAGIDAKRLLASGGPLSRQLGRSLPAGDIARAMRAAELHPDVMDLMGRLSLGLGQGDVNGPVVVHSRKSRS